MLPWQPTATYMHNAIAKHENNRKIIPVKLMYTSKKNIRNVRRLRDSRTTKSEEIR